MSPEGSSGLSGRDLKLFRRSSFGDEPLEWLVELLGLWLLDHTSGTPPVLALSDVSSLHGRGEGGALVVGLRPSWGVVERVRGRLAEGLAVGGGEATRVQDPEADRDGTDRGGVGVGRLERLARPA